MYARGRVGVHVCGGMGDGGWQGEYFGVARVWLAWCSVEVDATGVQGKYGRRFRYRAHVSVCVCPPSFAYSRKRSEGRSERAARGLGIGAGNGTGSQCRTEQESRSTSGHRSARGLGQTSKELTPSIAVLGMVSLESLVSETESEGDRALPWRPSTRPTMQPTNPGPI